MYNKIHIGGSVPPIKKKKNLQPKSKFDTKLDLNLEPEEESDKKSDELDIKPDIKPDKKSYIEPDREPDIEPDREPNIEPDREPDIKPDREPDIKPDREPYIKPDREPDKSKDLLQTNNLKKNNIDIINISHQIADKLGIDREILSDILKEKNIEGIYRSELMDTLIQKLLENDEAINKFEEKITIESTKINFRNLKNSLGKLQVLVLINKLKKSNTCDEVLNTFITAINNKIENVVSISSTNLQNGGSSINNNYFKYLKYKIKYYNLINM